MREIQYTVGVDSVTPSTVQFAGYAGEHNTTVLNFVLAQELLDEIAGYGEGTRYVLEVGDSSAEYSSFELELNENELRFEVPKSITEMSGRVTVNLSVMRFDENDNLTLVKYIANVRLRCYPSAFEGMVNQENIEDYNGNAISAMARAEAAAESAAANAQRAAEESDAASETYNNTVEVGQQIVSEAQDAAILARQSEGEATESKNEAKAFATTSSEMAGNASQYAAQAATESQSAATSALEAKQSAEQAQIAAQQAEGEKNSSELAANNAQQSASTAEQSAQAAADSASAASEAALQAQATVLEWEKIQEQLNAETVKKHLNAPIDVLQTVGMKIDRAFSDIKNDGTIQLKTTAGYNTTELIPIANGESLVFNGEFRMFCAYKSDATVIKSTFNTTDKKTNFTYTADQDGYVQVVVSQSYLANGKLSIIRNYGGSGLVEIEKDVYLNAQQIAQVKTELDSGYEYKNMLTGKKWVACGDSFTHGGSGLTDEFESGLYAGKTKTYPYWVGQRCGMVVVNEAVSGSTITNLETRDSAFSISRYQSAEFDDADYITLKFGINDDNLHQGAPIGTINDTDNSTFYGAWNVVLQHLITTHPTAHIGIIVTNGSTLDYVNATIAVAEKWGVPYLNMATDKQVPLVIRNNRTEVSSVARDARNNAFRISESDTHPNAIAHEYESRFIEAWLMTI